jgi:hypothetical protein
VLVNNSLRFRRSATAYLNRTPTTAGNRRTYTWSGWLKLGTLGVAQEIFGAGSGSNQDLFNFNADYQFVVFTANASQTILRTAQLFRDPSAWYHIVVAVDTTQATASDRTKIYVNGVQVTTFDYTQYPSQNYQGSINDTGIHYISTYDGSNWAFDGYMADINFIDGQQLTPNSFGTSNGLGVWQPIRYGGSYGTNGFYLPFTGSSSFYGSFNGSNQWLTLASNTAFNIFGGDMTVECWFNANSLANSPHLFAFVQDSTNRESIYFSSSALIFYSSSGAGSGNRISTVALSTGVWYHMALVKSGSTFTLYLNGAAVGTSTTTQYSTANQSLQLGTYNSGGFANDNFNGYMSNVRVVKGTAVYTGNFTPTTSPLTAITNTQLLTLQNATIVDNSTNAFSITNTGSVTTSQAYPFTMIGNQSRDYSPQGNNWTNNNIGVLAGSTLDYMTDVPTLTSATAANYGTLNPLYKGSLQTISNANLTSSKSSGTNISDVWGNFGMTSGKWYFECTVTALASTVYIGVGQGGGTGEPTDDLAVSPASYFYGSNDGNKFYGNTGTAYGNTFGAGNVIGCAIDMDNGKIWWSKDGTWQASGDPAAGTNAAFTDLLTRGSNAFLAFSSTNGASNSNTLDWNFGQRPFLYTSNLSGFKALNTFNLPTPTIGATASTTANKYFDATTFDGVTGGGTVTNSGSMQPDFVWMKVRNNANNHELADSVRGTPYASFSNLTNTEVSDTRVSAFNSNGFSYGTNSNSAITGRTVVGWQWRASNATAVTNTAGSITSTVSANTTAGFSIVTYTGNSTGGATVGHGLLVGGVATAPSMIIIKVRNATARWVVYQKDVITANNQFLALDTTAGVDTSGTNFWTISSINSTTFGLGTNGDTNGSTLNFVAYCFAPVAGYSAFGTYTGNGVSDGPFIYTGFRPRFVMIKASGTTGAWSMTDTSRDPYNLTTNKLEANTALSEASNAGLYQFDILSNGFKIRQGTGYGINNSADYIYMAFAENPFKYANAR